ncbi:MAG: hypothetical protein K8H85_04015, partial [Cyclobacteriaceae bacterium]|nr:hypothetical protein [Cyclobacteriaceae bacterium]
MRTVNEQGNGIPISISLDPTLEKENFQPKKTHNKRRTLTVSGLAVLIAAGVSIIAKGLVYLIDAITNISFYGSFSFDHANPADNTLGLFVIAIPAIGGLIVGI